MPKYNNYNARTYGKYGEIWRSTGKCVFCDLKDKYILKELDGVILTMNIFPYIDGHLLIIPRRHHEVFNDTTDEEFLTIKKLAELGKTLLRKTLNVRDVWFLYRMPAGFTAQKTVPHVHAHLIPYHENLFSWQYQNITVPVEEMAARIRKNI